MARVLILSEEASPMLSLFSFQLYNNFDIARELKKREKFYFHFSLLLPKVFCENLKPLCFGVARWDICVKTFKAG
jgi:uncharacterized protein with von Willebrand factor type A (vWA) domain